MFTPYDFDWKHVERKNRMENQSYDRSAGFTIVLKHKAPLAREAIFLPKNAVYMADLI